MHRSLRPSCFKTNDSASNLVSLATSRCTKFEKSDREAMKEHVDPTTVAVATMNHLNPFPSAFLPRRMNCVGKESRATHPSGNPYTKPAIVMHEE